MDYAFVNCYYHKIFLLTCQQLNLMMQSRSVTGTPKALNNIKFQPHFPTIIK